MRREEIELLGFVFNGLPKPEAHSPVPSSDGEDLLPEFCQYKDEGCRLAPSCLECPFPECAEDQIHGRDKISKQQRNVDIIRSFFVEKKNYDELSSQFAISPRTVRLIIAGRRKNFIIGQY
jgi:hypothetical protein